MTRVVLLLVALLASSSPLRVGSARAHVMHHAVPPAAIDRVAALHGNAPYAVGVSAQF